MEIHYQNKLEDWEEYYEFLLNDKEQGKKIKAILCACFAGDCCPDCPGDRFRGLDDLIRVMERWFIIFRPWVIDPRTDDPYQSKVYPARYYGALILKRRWKNIPEKEKKIFLQPKKLFMDENGLQIESSEAFHRWPWRVVEQMTLSPNLIIIQIDQRDKCLIPRRDFNPENGFLDFWQHALEYKELKGS
jgi:hypothetical protein